MRGRKAEGFGRQLGFWPKALGASSPTCAFGLVRGPILYHACVGGQSVKTDQKLLVRRQHLAGEVGGDPTLASNARIHPHQPFLPPIQLLFFEGFTLVQHRNHAYTHRTASNASSGCGRTRSFGTSARTHVRAVLDALDAHRRGQHVYDAA